MKLWFCALGVCNVMLSMHMLSLQKPDMAGLVEFLKPLNAVMKKASALAEGKRSNFFHHLKTGADSLSALAWIAYTGKDCGKKFTS